MKAIELLEQALPYVRGQNEALVRKIEKKLRKDGKQRELTVEVVREVESAGAIVLAHRTSEMSGIGCQATT
jgi:hypothetical protein